MSYDLDSLHQKYGLQSASVRFGTTAERSSITLITAVAGEAAVIHQVAAAASVWANFKVTVSTAAGTSAWVGFTGNTPLVEGTRILTDASTTLVFNATGIGADAGSGFFRVYFTTIKSTGAGIGSL